MKGPWIGEMVCDCKYQHQRIIEIGDDPDDVILQDGELYSYKHCCDPGNHTWEHPENPGPDYKHEGD